MDRIKSFFSSSSGQSYPEKKRLPEHSATLPRSVGRQGARQDLDYYGQQPSYGHQSYQARDQGFRGGYYPYSLTGGAGKKKRSGRKKSRKTKRKTRGRKSKRRA